MNYIIVGSAKIGDTTFDGSVYVGLDIDGSVELRPAKTQAFAFTQEVPALTLAQMLTTHHSSTLSFAVQTITV
jgi:hypothetical protein